MALSMTWHVTSGIYTIFDPNAMNMSIIRPEITIAQLEFKPMMFHMMQAINQYSGTANEYLYLCLR